MAAANLVAASRRYIVTDAKPYSTREIYDLLRQGLGKHSSRWGIPPELIRRLGHMGNLIGQIRGKRFLFDPSATTRLLDSAWYRSERISRKIAYRPFLVFRDAVTELVAQYGNSRASE